MRNNDKSRKTFVFPMLGISCLHKQVIVDYNKCLWSMAEKFRGVKLGNLTAHSIFLSALKKNMNNCRLATFGLAYIIEWVHHLARIQYPLESISLFLKLFPLRSITKSKSSVKCSWCFTRNFICLFTALLKKCTHLSLKQMQLI